MPMYFDFDFDSANRVLRCGFQEVLNEALIVEFIRIVPLYDAATRPRAVIVDLSQVITADLTSEIIAKYASLPPAFADKSLFRVCVAPKDDVYGLMRMFGALGEKTRPNWDVVRTAEEAYAILGVTNPHFEQVRLNRENSEAS